MVAALTLTLAVVLRGEVVFVETSSCVAAALDASALIAQLAIELAPEDVVAMGRGDGAQVQLAARCGDARVDVALTGASWAARFPVDVGEVRRDLRARTLAVVLAERWRTGRPAGGPTAVRSSTAPGAREATDDAALAARPARAPEPIREPASVRSPTLTSSPAPPSVPIAGDPPARASPLEPASPLASIAVRAAPASVAFGPVVRAYPSGGLALFGARLGGAWAVAPWLELALDAEASGGQVRHALGDVRLGVFGGALTGLFVTGLGPLRVGAGPRVAVAWAHAWGDATDAAIGARDGGTVVFMLGARATVEAPIAGAWSVVITGELGGVGRGVTALAGPDAAASVDGVELAALAALRWRVP